MRKAKILLILTVAAFTFSISGCKTEGCMDMDSVNYDAGADIDDGSCLYEGKVVLWYNEATSKALIADGATTLTVKLNGTPAGNTATSMFWTANVECGADGTLSITEDLGNVKTQSFSYTVEDQTGWEYWSGTLNFNANTCYASELAW